MSHCILQPDSWLSVSVRGLSGGGRRVLREKVFTSKSLEGLWRDGEDIPSDDQRKYHQWSLGEVTESLRGSLSFIITRAERALNPCACWALLVPGLSLGQIQREQREDTEGRET